MSSVPSRHLFLTAAALALGAAISLGLARFAFAKRIDAGFAQEERLGFGQHLQAGEIILKGKLLMQIDVETDEVDAMRAQELGGRIIGEGAEALGVG